MLTVVELEQAWCWEGMDSPHHHKLCSSHVLYNNSIPRKYVRLNGAPGLEKDVPSLDDQPIQLLAKQGGTI